VNVAESLGAVALRAGSMAGRAGLQAVRGISSTVLTATDGRDVIADNTPDGWEVERPWYWWTDPPNGAGRVWGNPIPGAGDPCTFGGIPAVARCTSIIVDTLAALPWKVYSGRDEQPTPSWVDDPQLLRMDNRVAMSPGLPEWAGETRWSAMDFWSQWILSALWFGDGFLYVPQRQRDSQPSPLLFVLHPDYIHLGGGRYWLGSAGTGQELDDEGRPELGRPFAPGEIIHLRGVEPLQYRGADSRNARGSGVLTRFASELGYGVDLRNYSTGVFSAGIPAGYLKSTQPHLSPEDAADLKTAWTAAHGGQRGIAVLNATTDFSPLTFTPVDAEMIGAGQDFDRHVAQAFGVPAYMLGIPGDSSTYANVESRMIELVRFTLLPWAARIEDVLSAQLPGQQSLKIKLDGLMRADTITRFQAYAAAISAGFMSIDEVRALEDMPPHADLNAAAVAVPAEPSPVATPTESGAAA
jgi:HK97 family phage portal protein